MRRPLAPDGRFVIEVRLWRVAQLFESMDPNPFYDRDLDPDADQFLSSHAAEAPRRAPLRILVHLADPAGDAAAIIRESIRNYYSRRADLSRREAIDLLRMGRAGLAIGLGFLFGCILAYEFAATLGGGPGVELARHSLLILGWVAMWHPLEIFLYGWWPIRARVGLYRRLSAAEVEVRQRG